MQKELLNQALQIFDTSEKWNAFVELANQKDVMKWHYFQKLKQPLLNYFNANPVEGWICEPWGDPNYDLRWYLKDFGKNSISLAVGWFFQFVLHVGDTNTFDTKKVDDLLKSDYSILLSSFDRVDKQFEHHLKVVEVRNYSFNSPYDTNFDDSQVDKLAWFAGNETEKFTKQIISKVERFRQNKDLTKMLYDLNAKTKIQTQ
ncbi:MAG: hypothetical protein MUC49_22105 [Raineya sp.]|jgi:hypothetical protein|nr:hypothetical protein [Raineya sp.]